MYTLETSSLYPSSLMISSPVHTSIPVTSQTIRLVKAGALRNARLSLQCPNALRLACAVAPYQPTPSFFSTTPAHQLRDFFPVKDTPHIKTTPAAWPHPGFTMEEMKAVVPAHRPPRTVGDWAAWKFVRFARYCMDKVTGMERDQKSDKKQPTTAVVAEKPLTESQWVSWCQKYIL